MLNSLCVSSLSRRQWLAALAASSLPTLARTAPLRQSITLSGPPSIVSAPLIHMAETNALASVAGRTTFTSWRDPDQLRMMAMGGKADVLAMPSNVAANLFNRGAAQHLHLGRAVDRHARWPAQGAGRLPGRGNRRAVSRRHARHRAAAAGV